MTAPNPIAAPAPRTPGYPGTPAAPGDDRAARELLHTFSLLRRVMRPRFARMGISFPQWAVLHNLYEAGQGHAPGLRLTDLADRLLVRPPSVTGAVDRLQRDGLVARTASPDDRRVTRVRLTGRGRRLVQKVQAGHLAHLDRTLGGLTGTQQTQLYRLLHAVSGHLTRVLEQEEADARR